MCHQEGLPLLPMCVSIDERERERERLASAGYTFPLEQRRNCTHIMFQDELISLHSLGRLCRRGMGSSVGMGEPFCVKRFKRGIASCTQPIRCNSEIRQLFGSRSHVAYSLHIRYEFMCIHKGPCWLLLYWDTREGRRKEVGRSLKSPTDNLCSRRYFSPTRTQFWDMV